MNTDRFIAEHDAAWTELEELSARVGSLDAEGSVRLVDLYRETATHLSRAQTAGDHGPLVDRLTKLVGKAHTAVYKPRSRTRLRNTVSRFFTVSFPAAVWWHRRFIVVSAMLFFVPALTIGAWMAVSPDAVAASAPESVRNAYLESDFESYYSSEPAAQFATQVFINNIQVAILAFAVGILLCIPTAWVLVQNGAMLGLAAGLFTSAGRWEQFWGLITPHGLLELSAIIVAGGAGLALGWSVIAPGDRPRSTAIAEGAKRSVTIVIGLILAFLVAGLIEAYVTGTDMVTSVRVGIGVVALAAFAGWILAFGPRAVRAGHTGVLGGDGVHQRDEDLSSI